MRKYHLDTLGHDAVHALPYPSYRETIDLLYSENTFDVERPSNITYLSRAIRPQRLNQIRLLKVSMHSRNDDLLPPKGSKSDNFTLWKEACNVLSSMKSLQVLVMSFVTWWHTQHLQQIHFYLEPLQTLYVPSIDVLLFDNIDDRTKERLDQMPAHVHFHVYPVSEYMLSAPQLF